MSHLELLRKFPFLFGAHLLAAAMAQPPMLIFRYP